MSMRAIVEHVAALIASEVPDAGRWSIERVAPVWRNPENGEALFVYAAGRTPSSETPFTGGRWDEFDIAVEYQEPIDPTRAMALERDEDAELRLHDIADAISELAIAHESLPEVNVHRFTWLGTQYGDDVRREMFIRFVRVTFRASAVIRAN